jgi:hypothetical protein
VGLSDRFVAAVHTRIDPKTRLALWTLRAVTKCPEPRAAGAFLAQQVDEAIRAAARDQGRTLTPPALEAMRGSVVDALLGEPQRCVLARERAVDDGRSIAHFLAGRSAEDP